MPCCRGPEISAVIQQAIRSKNAAANESSSGAILQRRGASSKLSARYATKRRKIALEALEIDTSSNVDNRTATTGLSARDRMFADIRQWGTQSQKILTGVQRLYEFQRMVLSGFIYRLHVFQKKAFARILQSASRTIVGEDEWKIYGPSIMKRFGWSTLPSKCFISAPRRTGKSIVVGVVQSAMALVMPCTQATFSTGKRASTVLREAVLKCLTESGFTDQLHSKGFKGEEITIIPLYCKIEGMVHHSKVSFYPGNEKIRNTQELYYTYIQSYMHTTPYTLRDTKQTESISYAE